jgi:F0F1-type ATP synthase assembly protein I
MARQLPPTADSDDNPKGDPWHALGYIVSGVALYGLAGWALDRWLGTTFLVAIGILIGAGFGIYMTYARFNKASAHEDQRNHDKRLGD